MNISIKSTYLLIGAALVISACSKDDIPDRIESSSNQIVFHTSLPTISSRADVISNNNLSYFHVTAFDPEDPARGYSQPLCDTVKVMITKPSGLNTSPNCVWPQIDYESHQLSFFGFHPVLENLGKNAKLSNHATNGFDYKLTGFSVAPDISDQVDFITAYGIGSMADNLYSGIDLKFYHQLCRVDVKAWSAQKSCHLEIAGVRIGCVNMNGTFTFPTDSKEQPDNGVGSWSNISNKGIVEYIYRSGDKIIELKKGSKSTSTPSGAVSIMGNPYATGNSAMMLPSDYKTEWQYDSDRNNTGKNLYISVLLRVIDATPTSGINPTEPQRYPYRDIVQGEAALENKIQRVYLAVKKGTNIVSRRLYKKATPTYDINDKKYFTDDKCSVSYTVPADEEVKEFGWAAVPITGNWTPGYAYTYTLDYSYGVGLHDPEVTTTQTPQAGDPIISDLVGIHISFEKWKDKNADYEIPGS